jgi:hypothetical protein
MACYRGRIDLKTLEPLARSEKLISNRCGLLALERTAVMDHGKRSGQAGLEPVPHVFVVQRPNHRVLFLAKTAGRAA